MWVNGRDIGPGNRRFHAFGPPVRPQRIRPAGRSALDRGLQAGKRLRHTRLELVRVLLTAPERQRREGTAEQAQPPRGDRPAVYDAGQPVRAGELEDPACTARLRVPGQEPARPHCGDDRSEEQTSELQSLMRISYAVF